MGNTGASTGKKRVKRGRGAGRWMNRWMNGAETLEQHAEISPPLVPEERTTTTTQVRGD